jgi:hypothetical protein
MSNIRQITADFPFDDTEDEVLFTRAAVKADPNASHLLSMTDDWLALVDAARAKDREARVANADATAARVVSNFHFDNSCTQFGDDLFLAVGKDRESKRWTQFFPIAVSRFVKMRFDKQIQKVQAWLEPNITEATLDKHRSALTTWCNAAAAALKQTGAVSMTRSTAQIAREQLADDMTRERDGLYDALSVHGRNKGLPRDWPKQFFRVTKRKSSDEEDTTPEPAAPEPAPGN